MSDTKFSNELKLLFDYIKNTLLKEYPCDKIGVEYFIVSAIENDGCVANEIFRKLLLSDTFERVRAHFYEVLSTSFRQITGNTEYDLKFEKCVSISNGLASQQKVRVINSGILLDAVFAVNENISGYFKSVGVFQNQIHNCSVEETKKINDDESRKGGNGTFLPSSPIKRNKKNKPTANKVEQVQNIRIMENQIQYMNPSAGECEKTFTNLLEEYRQGKIDQYYGGEKIYSKIFTILSKRNKNNVLIVGKNGVGKTSLVRNISRFIVENEAPRVFLDKKFLEVDFNKLIGGTMVRGALEIKMQVMMNDINLNRNYIFYIDDIGGVIDTNKNSESDIDDFITKVLDNKNVMVIISCSESDLKKIDSRSRWKRLYETINLEEPDNEACNSILRLHAQKLKYFHNVEYSDDVYDTTIKLCRRYITEQSLPDSAIDVLDETAARIRLNEKEDEEVRKASDDLKNVQTEKENLKNKTSKIDYEKLNELSKKEIELKSLVEFAKKQHHLGKKPSVVNLSGIKKTVSEKTGIPLEDMTTDDKVRLKNINARLKASVIGQDEAIDDVCEVVKRQRVGISNPDKPVVLFFGGSTGVGKTFLCKKLAKELFGNENDMIRLDMSEYSTDVSVTKIFGAPPSYIGYNDGGSLADKLKNKKYCVLLLDEIEKANEKVYDTFLQLFDEGRITDNHGNTVDCKNIIVVMTSNIGARQIEEAGDGIGFVKNESSKKSEIFEKELKGKFKPEFINRIDKIVYFNTLKKEELYTIIKNEIENIRKRIVNLGYDFDETITNGQMVDRIYEGISDKQKYGARPILRELQVELENKLTDFIIDNEVEKGHIFTYSEL